MNSYYLGIDLNLPDNIKIVKLKQKLGYSGFGLYLELCLRLAQAKDYKLPTDYELIAYQTRLTSKIVKEVIESFDLFTVKDGQFWCEEVVQKMHKLESKREAGKKAGIASGKARKQKKRTVVEQSFEQSLNNKENKGKKIKEINKENKVKHLDSVFLTENEHQKLIKEFGETLTKLKIESLNDYMMSTGKKYKSHYHTILSWIKKDREKAEATATKPQLTDNSFLNEYLPQN